MEEQEKPRLVQEQRPMCGTDLRISPINPNDPEELCELALRLTRSPTAHSLASHKNFPLAHFNTSDIEYGTPIVDPTKPEFDAYKWVRMFFRLSAEQGLNRRQAGFAFQNLTVQGGGPSVSYQETVLSVVRPSLKIRALFGPRSEKTIIHNFNGLVKKGELLVVLGRPGSGCSTLLKAITGELHNVRTASDSLINYDGITQEQMQRHFRGEIIYNEEMDKHFPNLTVGETLEFAAGCRAPQSRFNDISRLEWTTSVTQVAMAVLGLSHTYNTRVGNAFIHGISGGELKRVSIAEVFLAGASIVAWDNSTRGLDAATALKFVRSVRIVANLSLSCHAIAIYQASQSIYDEFDKATVLYEGRQIYFGPAKLAKGYFERMGWYCPKRQTTGDFLTSVTNPDERRASNGMEKQVPRTPEEFESYWRTSPEFSALLLEIGKHEEKFPIGGSKVLDDFKEGRKVMQANHTRSGSSYTISIPMQVKMCVVRAFRRLWHDRTSTVTTILGMSILALIIGSMFYKTPATTTGFSAKGGVLFFAILMNALVSLVEINDLYDQRTIVEKHKSYGFYHPWTEALAGVLANAVVKIITLIPFSIIIYFLSDLRAEPGPFFVFFLFNFVAALTMSLIFRTVAASTKTLPEAHTFAGVVVLAVIIYTGYIIPRSSMHPWFQWISNIDPIFYAFESLLLNEMHSREFACENLVPPYPGLTGDSFVCSYPGAVPGEVFVSGDAWLSASFGFLYPHLWRNLGIIVAFLIFFLVLYLVITEINSANDDAGEVLVFQKGHIPPVIGEFVKSLVGPTGLIPDSTVIVDQQVENDVFSHLGKKTDIFSWRDVTLDIKIKTGERRLLDGVSGWVKPGTLTALMGVSGAGKTTLLNVLASRSTIGRIGGEFHVMGRSRDASFQRKIGYVQQQDLHLETSTVREALQFSALLRQPANLPRDEKYLYVEDVIKMLNMSDFAEAIVGVPGEGLNVHQRKLLTIGVELAAKPGLLLFLDEPTSGLDSQSSWSIVSVLRQLADNGQPILSTIHQPSSTLFQQFDRLLLLGQGGKTVYFGEIGHNSETIIQYFQRQGARRCGGSENVAEYALEVVGKPPLGNDQSWHELWRASAENKVVHDELESLVKTGVLPKETTEDTSEEFAMPLKDQIMATTIRIFQQYWRTPEYIWGKLLLGMFGALFVGFSFFQANSSLQGIQNVVFAIFMITTIFVSIVNQILPRFIIQRSLYEERERPSKVYSWKAFLVANIVAEIPYHILLGVLIFSCFYYPVFGIQSSSRQVLILLYLIQFMLFGSTYAHLLVAAAPDASTAGILATVLFALCLGFNGVFQPPSALPHFWIFLYRVSPLTYFVGGLAATTLHARSIVCAANEIAVFSPPGNGTLTCAAYMQKYFDLGAPGLLINGNATELCEYCSFKTADQVLGRLDIEWSIRWRNFGILFAYIGFNVVMCVVLYYVFRVRRWSLKRAL